MVHHFLRGNSQRATAFMIVIFTITIMSIMSLGFLNRSRIFLYIAQMKLDQASSENSMEAGLTAAIHSIESAASSIRLTSRLPLHPESALAVETMSAIWDRYGSSAENSLDFLKHSLESQAYHDDGSLNSAHLYSQGFDLMFPSAFVDPNPSDNFFFEVKYSFFPREPRRKVSAISDEIYFEYDYSLTIRGYGNVQYSQSQSSQMGSISVSLRSSPFSSFAIFRSSSTNQNGDPLYFAGGNSPSQSQEVFDGPVHMNEPFYFLGHPIFNGPVSSTSAESTWVQTSSSTYDCCAVFNDLKLGQAQAISLPTQLSNVVRLAAGDRSPTAHLNTASLSENELANLLLHHSDGNFIGDEEAIPNGIYIPISNSENPEIAGGVYVRGDAEIFMNVVQGEASFNADYWNQIEETHRSCKFQKISVTSLEAGVGSKDVFVGDDPCNVTYVFNATNALQAPGVFAGRINGNIHVDGAIDRLGGESRTRPAIAQDFGFTISATKDVRIYRDLQYEDVEYYSSTTHQLVANAWGPLNSSGINPSSAEINPAISEESKTILGIISTHRNILLHAESPSNINLHAALFAGNENAYDAETGLGCGADISNQKGCGFGVEGWDSRSGLGQFKFLGSISEFKSQSMGTAGSPPTGYQRRIRYDQRLRQDIMPPAFPLSTDIQAYPQVKSLRTWKISQAD